MPEECICPYCMEPLDRQKIKFYLKQEKEPISSKLEAFLKPERIRQEENPFYRFWNSYGRKIDAKTLETRIVKSREEMDKAQAFFAADADKISRRAGQEEAFSLPDETEMIQPGQSAGKRLDGEDASSQIICEIKREQMADGVPKYTIREDGQRIALTKVVCPECYNVLPEEIFRLPLIKIALAANKFGGKTCMALSLFRTLNSPDRVGLNSHNELMDFVSMLEANRGMDDEFGEMLKEFREKNICPEPTGQRFIPPVFLKLHWRGKREKEAIVGIYDAAGEILTGSIRDSELVYYMSYMDGIIYMIEPDKTGIRAGLTSKYLFFGDDSEPFYKNARLLEPGEQMAVQSEDSRRVTLEAVMEQQSRDPEDGGMSAVRKNASLEVQTALRSYVDDDRLKEMHVALTISKCDELKGNKEIEEYNSGGLLFRDEREMDPDLDSMREDQLFRLFNEKVFNLQFFENVFKSYSLHMIAALGCPTEVPKKDGQETSGEMRGTQLIKPRLKGDFSPIRVEEPLLKLISIYAEEHGWNEG